MYCYQMSGYELGTYMEIYLPKKVQYQQFLFGVLTHGLNIETVRKHFLSAKNRPGILRLLGPESPWGAYSKEYVAQLRPFLYGYSMYEVDGVFKGVGKDAVVEERTQVLRLLFRMDLEQVARDANVEGVDRQVLRGTVSDYLRAHDRQAAIQKSAGRKRRIYEAARNWRDQLGFFVFGYIVYELGRQIAVLCKARKVTKTEDEIWVTNFANVELDRVLWRRPNRVP